MIKEMKGNALDVECDVLAHQTNYYGIMGGGIASQIKEELLDDEAFKSYTDFCDMYGEEALGMIELLKVDKKCKYVANLFGQRDWDTDYKSLKSAMNWLNDFAKTELNNGTIVIPGYIGCGIAGGDWNKVYNDIIKPIFENSPVELTIVYFE